MPVRYRSDKGTYEAQVSQRHMRWVRSFPSANMAKQWELKARQALARGQDVPEPEIPEAVPSDAPRHTWGRLLLSTSMRYWQGKGGGPWAIANAGRCVELLGEDRDPSKLTRADVSMLVSSFKVQGLSESTINRRLSALSRMLSHGVEDLGWFETYPKIRRFSEGAGRDGFIDRRTESEMLGWCEENREPQMRAFIILGLDTGCRKMELLTLIVGEVDLEAHDGVGEIVLKARKTKSGKPRAIPLTPRARAELVKLTAGKRRARPVFCQLSLGVLRRRWDAMRDALGRSHDDEFVPHLMRHTFCSRLVQAGESATVIQRLAGHSSIMVTERYMHLAPGNRVGAIAKLSL